MNISAASTGPAFDIDDLPLTRCVLGHEYIVLINGAVALYWRAVRRVALIGVFAGPAEAFEALDAFDAPSQPTSDDPPDRSEANPCSPASP